MIRDHNGFLHAQPLAETVALLATRLMEVDGMKERRRSNARDGLTDARVERLPADVESDAEYFRECVHRALRLLVIADGAVITMSEDVFVFEGMTIDGPAT